jgi:hypothetical protein
MVVFLHGKSDGIPVEFLQDLETNPNTCCEALVAGMAAVVRVVRIVRRLETCEWLERWQVRWGTLTKSAHVLVRRCTRKRNQLIYICTMESIC